MSELCKAGEHDDCHLYWCSCSCHGRYAESYDRTERVEYTQRFFETDWETAVQIDDFFNG